jgi:hypothetical protein
MLPTHVHDNSKKTSPLLSLDGVGVRTVVNVIVFFQVLTIEPLGLFGR